MKKFVFASVATLMASGAFAGGYVAPVVEQPVVMPIVEAPAPSFDWTGWYAGLQYGQGSATLKADGFDDVDEDTEAYGLHAGYTRDLGNWVVGGELDYNKVDFDDSDGDADMIRLRGRAGYDMGRFLPYVTAGAAHISADSNGVDLSDTGWTYGIGAEYLVSQKFSVGLEYTRNDFSDVVDNAATDIDLDTDLVSVRASYRF